MTTNIRELPVLSAFRQNDQSLSPDHPWSAQETLAATYSRIHAATGARPQHIPEYYERKNSFHVLAWIAELGLCEARTEVLEEGGADGWDQAIGHAARNLGIVRVLNVPFNGQHLRWKPWVVERYADLMETADVAYAVADPDRDDRRAVVTALMDRNVEMLRWGGQLVLAFNPPHREHEGGTAACIREAKKRGLKIRNLYPMWEKYLAGELRVIHELKGTELSNMEVLDKPIRMGGLDFHSVEHFYQAAKTRDPEQRKLIQEAATPYKARELGRKVQPREDWDDIRLEVMEAGLRKKFAQPRLAAALAATGDALILEGNTWGDTFWGVCRNNGRNHLGRLLMQIRSEL